uniref:Uncharacterized protein n=1 Tax=Anopheles dirus TaxID=7168 RepID=A0A182NGL9_9DIPT
MLHLGIRLYDFKSSTFGIAVADGYLRSSIGIPAVRDEPRIHEGEHRKAKQPERSSSDSVRLCLVSFVTTK